MDPAGPGTKSPSPGRGRPRRRRRGPRREGNGKPAPGAAEAAAPPDVLPAPKLDASKPSDDPLGPEEVAEMRGHLRFLFKHRKTLRLKVNASEDLLLNGAREPTHRGACLHLLSKVDLSAVESALTRVTLPAERVELLSGVVRFSTDVGVLLLWLESLAGSASRAEAAAAFERAVARIDFSRISSARMRRVLDLVARTFEGHERVQVLFNLLRSQGFRDAFDASAEKLPEELAGLFVPLRAVHETVLEGRPDRFGADVLAEGVTTLLSAPQSVLTSYSEPVRERLLESAVRLADPQVADRAEDALLESLPASGRSFSRLAMLRAAELLRRREDERAKKLLARLRAAHPGFQKPQRWLDALDAPRVGRLALVGREGGRLRFAFWLDGQHPAWVRLAGGEEGVRALEEASFQRDTALAGVAPVILSGVADDGVAYVAMPALGQPAGQALKKRRPSRPLAALVAAQAAQVLGTLAASGAVLPDAAWDRFLLGDGEQPLLWLADLSGLARVPPSEAGRRHLAPAIALALEALSGAPEQDVAPAALLRIRAARDLAELVRLLAAEA